MAWHQKEYRVFLYLSHNFYISDTNIFQIQIKQKSVIDEFEISWLKFL